MDRLVESVIRASPPDGLFERRIERHPNLAGSASWTSHPVFQQLTGNPLGLAGLYLDRWEFGHAQVRGRCAVVLMVGHDFHGGRIFVDTRERDKKWITRS
jgi:hypothetical protein